MSDHQYLNPFLALPRNGAVFFAGSAFYIGFIDTGVRDSLRNPRTQLTQWANMYKRAAPTMAFLAAGTALAALKAFQTSKEPLWLIGGLTMFAIIPYTVLFMRGLNNELKHEDRYSGDVIDITKRDGIIAKLKTWANLHRVRFALAAVAAFVFYIAEGESNIAKPDINIAANINVK